MSGVVWVNVLEMIPLKYMPFLEARDNVESNSSELMSPLVEMLHSWKASHTSRGWELRDVLLV